MLTLDDVWPLFRLRLATPRLALRPLRDEDLPALAEAAASGIHDPARTPFAAPWTDAPAGELAANTARWVWGRRSELAADAWTVQFGVFAHDGALLGAQDVSAARFTDRRTIETGSWLRRDAQGRGYGAEMRAAVLLWAFDCLGAEVAETAAFDWNAASLGVSRRLGYGPNGETRHATRPGVVERELKLRLLAEDFRRPEWELEVGGGPEAATFLGIPTAEG
ncbi:GNAT family N-acetyltransferase [Sinomonas mesophila]|uniref:GNAT family N-acetyltransferase n=1 Tax=Sinomonas mesophila TaxID=1531955 RepID=UPI0009867A83|nr:GNAT family protein [Sinomonas mesophila]